MKSESESPEDSSGNAGEVGAFHAFQILSLTEQIIRVEIIE